MSRTIFITGGAGFIGSHIARQHADRGDRVVIFDQRPPVHEAAYLLQDTADRVRVMIGAVDQWPDVLKAVGDVKPDAIVHTAAIGDPAIVQYQPMLALRVNLEGSLHVLEASRLCGVRRVVLFSSIGALPGIRQPQPIDTNHPVICADEGPGSGFYGASKVAVEAFAYGYHDAYETDFIVLRPSAVYGFGMRHPIFIKPMVENAVDGKPTIFENGREFPRDYTHVEDVAQLALRAVDQPADKVKDRIFYAATGQPLRTAGDVADIVRALVPDASITIGSGLSESDKLEIRYRAELSIRNAESQLGYRPRFGRLEDGIARYVRTYGDYRKEQPA